MKYKVKIRLYLYASSVGFNNGELERGHTHTHTHEEFSCTSIVSMMFTGGHIALPKNNCVMENSGKVVSSVSLLQYRNEFVQSLLQVPGIKFSRLANAEAAAQVRKHAWRSGFTGESTLASTRPRTPTATLQLYFFFCTSSS